MSINNYGIYKHNAGEQSLPIGLLVCSLNSCYLLSGKYIIQILHAKYQYFSHSMYLSRLVQTLYGCNSRDRQHVDPSLMLLSADPQCFCMEHVIALFIIVVS